MHLCSEGVTDYAVEMRCVQQGELLPMSKLGELYFSQN